MTENSWIQKQALYLRSNAYGYWFGSNGPLLIIYLILRHNQFDFLPYWFLGSLTFSAVSFSWRRRAAGLLRKNLISPHVFYGVGLAILAIKALLWSCISFKAFQQVEVGEQSFICMMVTGVAAGSISVNGAVPIFSLLTLPALLLPLMTSAWLTGGTYGELLCLAAFIFMLVLMKAAVVIHSTLKKEFEMALRNHKLRRQLEEQTANIVSQAQQASLGEMSGNMAHEINNPLTILTTTVDLLQIRIAQSEFQPSQIESIIQKMRTNIERITKIIKELRHFSGNIKDEVMKPESINTLFNQISLLCRGRLEAEGIEFKVRSCEQNLLIDCRASDMCHALLNLINNSRQALEPLPEKWIRLEALPMADAIEIRITDSGRGINEEFRDRIMEPFFTTHEVGQGVGLGLSISQAIVKAHRGTLKLDIHSPYTSFIIRLPYDRCSLPQLYETA